MTPVFSGRAKLAISLAKYGVALCVMFILSRPRKNEPRKRTKGSNTPSNPRARKIVPLSLHSFFRESKHLQLLRLQVKETCKHGSNTQVKQQKFLLSATHSSATNFSTKTILLPRLPSKRAVEAPASTKKAKRSCSLCLPRVVAILEAQH